MIPHCPRHRSGRSMLAPLLFIAIFEVALLIAAYQYLVPAIRALKSATPEHRGQLAAVSALVLALLLFALVVGLIMAIRIGRIFRRSEPKPPTNTNYPDAWTEAGRRLEPPPAEEEDEDER